MSKRYKRAYNYGQKVIILDTEQVGIVTGFRIDGWCKIEIATGVDVWKHKDEIDDFDLWLEDKR